MPKGFFSETTETTRKALPLIAQCGACGLFKKCLSPKVPVAGKGKKGILIVSGFPGETEESHRFHAETDNYLENTLRSIGIKMKEDCWLTYAAICHPPKNSLPDKAVEYCRPNLIQAIERLKPRVIILLGGPAVKSLIGYLWREDCGGLFRWIGWRIPCQKYNCWICPNLNTGYVVREHKNAVVALTFKKFLQRAIAKKERPWRTVPDYVSQCKVELNTNKAAAVVREITANSEIVAFDYETSTLKPDSDVARIVSCSVSNGKETIAYPWYGEAIQATKELLDSEVGKIASNMKFEERWSRKEFGHGVRNWNHDTMLDSHILDNREGITSIKFLAFAMLGQPTWDDHVKAYLTSDGANKENRIKELDLPSLLKYNAMDSLMEYRVAMLQKKEIERGG